MGKVFSSSGKSKVDDSTTVRSLLNLVTPIWLIELVNKSTVSSGPRNKLFPIPPRIPVGDVEYSSVSIMLPSASIGEKTSLYEPIHGSFSRAAGKGVANPIGTILSAALLLEYAFNLQKEANSIREAVKKALKKGYGTKDIAKENALSTSKLGDAIVKMI